MRDQIKYFAPKTVAEAVKFLKEHEGKAKVVNGGTDLMIDIRSGEFEAEWLVSIKGLEELCEVKAEADGRYSIGAGCTIEKLRTNPIVMEHFPLLAKAATNFAGLQVRNMGTVGGNVGHASPCGDTQPPLIAYDAEAVLVSADGERRLPLEQVFVKPYQSCLKPTEIITRFIVTPKTGAMADFQKIGRRKDLAISRVTLAVIADTKGGAFSDVRIVLGACKPTCGRMPKTEAFLSGKKVSLESIKEAAKFMSSEMIEVTGRRASVAYKEPAIAGLLVRILLPLVKAVR